MRLVCLCCKENELSWVKTGKGARLCTLRGMRDTAGRERTDGMFATRSIQTLVLGYCGARGNMRT